MATRRPSQTRINALRAAKQKRRRALARLPFEKKIDILLDLQKIAHDLPGSKSKGKSRIWNISG